MLGYIIIGVIMFIVGVAAGMGLICTIMIRKIEGGKK